MKSGVFLPIALLASSLPISMAQDKAASAEAKWEATKAKLEADGFVFEIEKFFPPAGPRDDNFAEHRLIAETFTEEAREDRKASRLGKVKLTDLPDFPRPPQRPNISNGSLTDLANLVGEPDLDRDAAARKMLEGLDTWRREFDGLIEAAARPSCRFPIDPVYVFNDGAISIPFNATRHLAWRASSRLQLGQTQPALVDVIALLQLERHSLSNPSMIGLLISNAINRSNLVTIREGIALERWDDAALAQFEKQLSQFDFIESYHKAARFELANSATLTMEMIGGNDELLSLVDEEDSESLKPENLYRQLTQGSLAIQRLLFPEADRKPSDLPGRLAQMERYAGKLDPDANDPDTLARDMVRSYCFGGKRALRQQADINSARIAIALERYRLADKQLPASLDPLTPRFLEELPVDPMTGKPPHYGKNTEGFPVIYSVGWDRDDDGGEPVNSISDRDGDWVWHTRLEPEPAPN